MSDLRALALECLGSDPFNDEAEVRMCAAGEGGGFWCDLFANDARKIARLIVAALDAPAEQ